MARPRKAAPKSGTAFTGFRLPAALLKAIDTHVERMRKRDPYGMPPSRSDAARELLALGLRAVEEEEREHGR